MILAPEVGDAHAGAFPIPSTPVPPASAAKRACLAADEAEAVMIPGRCRCGTKAVTAVIPRGRAARMPPLLHRPAQSSLLVNDEEEAALAMLLLPSMPSEEAAAVTNAAPLLYTRFCWCCCRRGRYYSWGRRWGSRFRRGCCWCLVWHDAAGGGGGEALTEAEENVDDFR